MVPPDTSVPTMDAMTIAPVHGVQFRGAGCQCDVAAPAAPRTSRGALAFALAIALAFVLRKRD
jgi:MYXO-CTERM domain-containing protein